MIDAMKKAGCRDWMTASRYVSLSDAAKAACGFINRVYLVVMGCDGRYWVVSARDAGMLRKAGYETI